MTGGPAAAAETSQRARILDAALVLVSELGAAGTSMRRLAGACGLNVATIYHYFPSKADLLRALIEERRYGERLATEEWPIDPALPPRQRLARLLTWVAERTLEEDAVLRLIVGEGMRGNATARASASELVGAIDTAVTAWLTSGFPELAGGRTAPATAARLARDMLLAVVIERMATGSSDVGAHARDLAAALFPEGADAADGDT